MNCSSAETYSSIQTSLFLCAVAVAVAYLLYIYIAIVIVRALN